MLERKRLCLYTSTVNGRASAREIIAAASGFGVGGVELMSFCDEMRTPDPRMARALCSEARDLGLALPCFSVYADLYRDFDTESERLRRYAQICAENSIPLLHHTVDPDLSLFTLSESERRERFLRMSERLMKVVEFTESVGVATVIEDQGFIFNGSKALCEMVKATSGKVDILADIGNCHFVDEDISGIVGALFERIKHVHIKDYRVTDAPIPNQRSCKTQNGRYLTDCEIGVGDIGVSDAIATLEGAGYKGMYSLEFAKLSSDDEPLWVIERLTGSDR